MLREPCVFEPVRWGVYYSEQSELDGKPTDELKETEFQTDPNLQQVEAQSQLGQAEGP